MKKKFSTIVLGLTVALLSSCNGNDIVEETAISNVKTKAIEQIKSRCSVVDGILHFSSTDDYYALTDSLCELSDIEFENWENQNNFLSYRTYVNRIIDEIESAQNENDVDKVSSLLKEYSNYVYLSEEDFAQPVIQATSYRSIVNKDGIFYFNDTENVVDGRYVYVNNKSVNQRGRSIKQEYVVYGTPLTKATPNTTEINFVTIAYTKEDGTRAVNKTYSFDRYIPIKVPESKDSTHVQPGYHYDMDAELSLTVPANQYEYTVTPLRIYPEHIDRRLYISFDMGYTYTGIRTVHYYLEPMR